LLAVNIPVASAQRNSGFASLPFPVCLAASLQLNPATCFTEVHANIDLIVFHDGEQVAVQCKQWITRDVGVKPMREFLCALERFKNYHSRSVMEREERSFLVLASFRLSHRPLRACSFAKSSPKLKKSSLRTTTLILKTL